MKGEFHAPSLGDFFPDPIWLHDVAGGWFTIDRLMVVRLFVILLVAIFFGVAFHNPKLVPGKLQNAAEMVLDFVRTGIAEDILGKKEGKRFLPLITTTFVIVFFLNLPSVIPFLNISPNARIGMPLVMAIVGYIAFIYAGSRKYGFFKFMKSSVVIPNMPPVMHLIVVPIEFISTFILRPVTLTIRLMANMLSGHLILALIFGATNFFFWQLNGWTALSAVTLVAAILFTLFELLVIFLQAYIFALLVAVYIDLSLHASEH
ncbi:F0F1 ATP synthase subunit A [Lawsonella clevelandensis]|uniref:ATP synthase subunit a n=1 Tax=Lawsonella clevelandensis TaxID=1528099 RepID=A0A0M4MBH7_9ACTN|nr:F0F1 ATP synthase subunit A [Lawsonella clevelandensis]ALE18612.1 ATP synthase F0F1 subunit A [Lawsonella clevelandensis]ALE34279.1 ATP synthase F0F1 subunit A [Lawsonella clevelandensis]MDU7193492.1 F0F1 ATP synthase subunit A [Lawsonella clevelandensis]VHN99913.1 ATP synthase subunit a [Lawsonella clevelandensis]